VIVEHLTACEKVFARYTHQQSYSIGAHAMVELVKALKELVVEVGKLGPNSALVLSLVIILILLISFVIQSMLRLVLL
jgi:hypothetical protein